MPNGSTHSKSTLFSIVHKVGANNKVADALSRRHGLLAAMATYTLGFEHVPKTLKEDPDFGQVLEEVKRNLRDDYSLHNEYLFKGVALCIPATSLRYLIIKEMHNQGHFGLEKTLHLVLELNISFELAMFVKHLKVPTPTKAFTTHCLFHLNVGVTF
jgi:hypothetical protein